MCVRHRCTNINETDLEVIINDEMTSSVLWGIAPSKSNHIVGIIKIYIKCMEKKVIIPLNKAIVRPHKQILNTRIDALA